MAKNLVIVESPAKAKTIEGFLGKDFLVKSSFGHVRDLVKEGMGIDIEKNFTPRYEVSPDKEKVIAELKKLVKTAETVWLASDEDREGEAISWHLFETLNLKKDNTRRIVFNEITKPAVLKAIENPRDIDVNLVNAQQARRVLDRLVGFEISPILWRKVRPSLSAGRVQSVSVRLIVEREREIYNFESKSTYKIVALFATEQSKGKPILKAELPERFATEAEANDFLTTCMPASFTIGNLETKPAKKSPAAPFTTSTLQQEASRKLGFSVSQTMVVAQKLYESGKITYMRTDSVNLSETALEAAKDEIIRSYGPQYSNPRRYSTKSKGAQEAHEAIRPTYMQNSTVEGDNGERRLYELIWKRTIASQMAEAQLERTTATINISTTPKNFIAQGEVLKFDGFLKVYLEGTDDENADEADDKMLPPLRIGEVLGLNNITATQRFSSPPARYTEASLVKKLEELGIGRPSTYAPTISTIIKRQYVVKEDREGKQRNFQTLTLANGQITKETKTENYASEKAKLFPTDIGTVVNDFLIVNFPNILDFNFTAKVEKEFDDIAEGLMPWTNMIGNFYHPFHKEVERSAEKSERPVGERILGEEEGTGKPISVRIGRYGPYVQIGASDEDEKPRYASLRKDQRIETITLEEALELFKLPRFVGEFEGKEMTAAIGRFGPFIKHASAFYSIPKDDDPYTIGQERAIEIIENKRQADIEKVIKLFPEKPEVKVLNGRWGPYIAIGKENYKIPKDKVAADLSLEDCLAIAAAPKPEGGKKRFVKKK